MAPGLATRELAATALQRIIAGGFPLDDAWGAALAGTPKDVIFAPSDRALARAIVLAALRHYGQLSAVLERHLERGWPPRSGGWRAIMVCAAAQLLVVGVPAHAVLNLAVDQVRRDRRARSFEKLANAVLRQLTGRLEAQGTAPADVLATIPPLANLADWQRKRWSAAYGAPVTEQIAQALTRQPPLDLVLAQPAMAQYWADKLGGTALAGGIVRLATTNVEQLEGYAEGAWWVQDYAATLPVRVLAPQAGERIADLCAAPGGKTSQLCAAGAKVTAVDSSPRRTEMLADNMARLGMAPTCVTEDIRAWAPGHAGQFDAVLLDAPCSATGTIRRHPDILRRPKPTRDDPLLALQADLLTHAASLVRPGGRLVFATCSMDPGEGPKQIDAFVDAHPQWTRHPVGADDRQRFVAEDLLPPSTPADLRTLPFMSPPKSGSSEAIAGGMDGFFISRLVRAAG